MPVLQVHALKESEFSRRKDKIDFYLNFGDRN